MAGTSVRPVQPVAPAMQTEITASAAFDQLDAVGVREQYVYKLILQAARFS
jgi:hypothetical protein